METRLRVSQAVRQGEVLVEIDAMPDRLQLQQERVRAQGLTSELARLRAEVAAEETARAQEQSTARLSAEEAGNRIREDGDRGQGSRGRMGAHAGAGPGGPGAAARS